MDGSGRTLRSGWLHVEGPNMEEIGRAEGNRRACVMMRNWIRTGTGSPSSDRVGTGQVLKIVENPLFGVNVTVLANTWSLVRSVSTDPELAGTMPKSSSADFRALRSGVPESDWFHRFPSSCDLSLRVLYPARCENLLRAACLAQAVRLRAQMLQTACRACWRGVESHLSQLHASTIACGATRSPAASALGSAGKKRGASSSVS